MEWSAQDVQLLLDLHGKMTWGEIAAKLDRNEEAVRSKYRSLERDIPTEENQTEYRSMSCNLESARKAYKDVLLRAAVFDIETTSLQATGVQDHLVCCSILPLDAASPSTLN